MTTPSNDAPRPASPLVRWTRRLESTAALDPVARVAASASGVLVADPTRRSALQGTWLGHALHPPLTDVPIGFWTSASVLDLLGGKASRPAATRLVALGLLSALPTAVTGLAEYAEAGGAAERRVGVAHSAANTVALGLYAASLDARRRERPVRGAVLGLAGGAALALGGYLGGHLVAARKVGSRHPAFR